MIIPVVIGATALIGGAFAFFHKSGSTGDKSKGGVRTGVSPTANPILALQSLEKGMDTALARAVIFAKNNVNDPKPLQEFGSSLLPEFPISSKALMLKSSKIPVAIGPIPGMVAFSGEVRYQLNFGETLHVGDILSSPDRRAQLHFQSDGNLVLINEAFNTPMWGTMTQGRGAVELKFSNEGNLRLIDENGTTLWESPRGANALAVQNDGNMVLKNDGKGFWTTETAGYRISDSVGGSTNIFEDAWGIASDFANSTVGGILLHILEVATFTELVSALPGIGQLIGNTLATLGPVANDMLPGLAKGERVDRVFINSLKSVTARALAAGGASGAAEVAGPYLQTALQTGKDSLASIGLTPQTFSEKMDQLRQAAGGLSKDDALPMVVQQQFEDFVNTQLSKLPSTKELAQRAGVPEDLMQVTLDGMTRSNRYPNKQYNSEDGSEVDPAVVAAKAAKKAEEDRLQAVARRAAFDNDVLMSTIDKALLSGKTAAEVYGIIKYNSGMYEGQEGKYHDAAFADILDRQRALGKQDGTSKVLPLIATLPPSHIDFPAVGSHALAMPQSRLSQSGIDALGRAGFNIHGDGIDWAAWNKASSGFTTITAPTPIKLVIPKIGMLNLNAPEDYLYPVVIWDSPIGTGAVLTAKPVALVPQYGILIIAGPPQNSGLDTFYPVTYTDEKGVELARGYIGSRNLDGGKGSWGKATDDDRYVIRARYVKAYNAPVNTSKFDGLKDAEKMHLALSNLK